MADQLSISLRAWRPQNKLKDSLPYLISRINEQKGSFRNITEASLKEEIRAAQAGESKAVENGDDEEATEDGQDTKAKGDELSKAREEIIKQIGAAHTASSHALDFVSLLLSKHTSKTAEATISPFVKANIPMGSLGAEIMQEPSKSEAEKTSEGLVSLGWRMQSLSRSADSLLKSASRLEQEVEREARYWQQILAVKESGWSLCRLPGEGHTLGVRFGFSEAHAEFRDRGLAALRRDPDGNIKLDRGPRWQGDKQLRVRLLQNGKPTATSKQPPAPNSEDLSLPQLLLRARNSLFDSELHHELTRECRNLIAQGVHNIGTTIRFPFNENTEIEIDFVATDPELGPPLEETKDGDPTIPSAVLTTLRILLSHAHRENLIRRSQPPGPITDTPSPRRFYSLKQSSTLPQCKKPKASSPASPTPWRAPTSPSPRK
ncbi:MAG: hypothetical protein Q9170_007173 [Blastenia crenularia]